MQYKGPLAMIEEDPARGYALVTYFTILSNGARGKMYSKALYDVDEQDPSKCVRVGMSPSLRLRFVTRMRLLIRLCGQKV